MAFRIYQKAKGAMQSGRAKIGQWVLEADPESPSLPSPLTGWSGGAKTTRQVQLVFDDKQAAIDYAQKQGMAYRVIDGANRKIKPKAYADNFNYNRVMPWTH